MAFRNYTLKLKTRTWKRDSYGLYDYENNSCQVENLSASHPGQLIRRNHHVSFMPFDNYSNKRTRQDPSQENRDEAIFCAIEKPEGIEIVAEGGGEEDSGQLWTIAERGDNMRGHILKAQDVIKLGRVIFKVSQIRLENQRQGGQGRPTRRSIIDSIKDHRKDLETFIVKEIEQEEEENNTKSGKGSNAGVLCKICLYDKSDEENDPLISPCKCIGSVKYVHLKCMQNWVRSKLNMQHNKNIITILWKNLHCELCKDKLPITLEQDGEILSLIPFDEHISGSYVMLESFSKEKDSTGIHLIDLSSNQNFKIGRGHDSDLKVSDISVSRIHSVVTVFKGNLYIRDNNSKFGTLVLKKDPIVLNSGNMKSGPYQCGRTVVVFNLKRPWLSYFPFLRPLCCISMPSNAGTMVFDSQGANEEVNDDETRIRIVDDEEDIRADSRPSV